MALTEAQIVANELETVEPKVPILFDWDDTFYSTIEKKNTETVSSRDMRIPLNINPGGNFGYYNPDGGDMGRGDGPTFDKAVIASVHFRHGVEWTFQSQISTDDSRKAVVNTFKNIVANAMKEYRRQVDSQCMTTGNGVIANPSGVTAGGGTSGGDRWVTSSATDGFKTRLLRKNQTVGIYDSTLATKRGEAKINFLDNANSTFDTYPAIAGVQNTDKIVVSGLTSNPVGLFGVPYHNSNASSGTWLGFNRSTTPEIRANRVNAAGALALPLPRLAVNKIGDRVGINEMSKAVAWMHPCQKDAFEQLGQMVSIINKSAKEDALNPYFGDAMIMAGCPVKCSFSWDKTRIDFIVDEIWGRCEIHPAKFYEVGGQRFFPIRGASGGLAAANIFYIVSGWNLFNMNPARSSYIDGLTIPSGY